MINRFVVFHSLILMNNIPHPNKTTTNYRRPPVNIRIFQILKMVMNHATGKLRVVRQWFCFKYSIRSIKKSKYEQKCFSELRICH